MAAATLAAAAAADMYGRDALIGWYRGEFAAANAIIDALCRHVAQMNGGDGSEYEGLFAAIHRRRLNWIPVLQMQKFWPISDVAEQLARLQGNYNGIDARSERSVVSYKKSDDGSIDSSVEFSDQKVHPLCDYAGSQEEEQADFWESARLCFNHEACATRREIIKILKGFQAREPMRGHMVNVVKGLKVYEEMFTNSELGRLSEFISELRLEGHRGELSGETFIYFNKQMKGNKKEIIQLGVPLFQSAKEDSTSKTEPIPPIIEEVIDHLVQWRLLPEGRRPNSCIINFFDEDEFSQPYFKPPHIDTPISTLVLSETTLAFGRVLASDSNGTYKGSLTLPLKEGSLLVMRGNSADMARHVVCPSSNQRVTITFLRVRPVINHPELLTTPTTSTMALWQPEASQPQKILSTEPIAYATPQSTVAPTWGPIAYNSPVVMWASRPMMVSPGSDKRSDHGGGTGVFLPWTVGPKKHAKHLPPRIQKRRFTPSFN